MRYLLATYGYLGFVVKEIAQDLNVPMVGFKVLGKISPRCSVEIEVVLGRPMSIENQLANINISVFFNFRDLR